MLRELAKDIRKLVKSTKAEKEVKNAYMKRIGEGNLTHEENPLTHFCVYFAALDPENKDVFIGHHKKSGLWLFNGGHIDRGEIPEETLEREIQEEWGRSIELDRTIKPSLLTITEINNPTKQKCRQHYDIWHFIPVRKRTFTPDENLLKEEFHQIGWKSIKEAKRLISDPNTLTALGEIEELFKKV